MRVAAWAWGAIACTALALLMWVGEAKAAERDAAAAELLFQEGRDAMVVEDFDTACQMFQESFDLDPAVGTVMNLAVCEEKRGHLAASWERWHQALRLLEPDDDRVEFAEQQLESIASRLAYLKIRVQGAPVRELRVMRDGVALGKASLGQELPADPGEHVVTVESDRYETKSFEIALTAGEHAELVVGPGPAKPKPPKEPSASGIMARRIGGYSALGVGALGLGTALATGFLLPAQDKKVDEHCPNKVCDSAGTQAIYQARTLLVLNTVGWIAAGVGAATGTALLVTLPHKNKGKEGPHKQSRNKQKSKASDNSASENGEADARSESVALGIALVGSGIRVFGEF